MSNHPTAPHTSTDRPTATYPTGQWLARLEHAEAVHPALLADIWADRTPTELLPAVGRPASSRREHVASTTAGTAFPRVSTLPEPTSGREALRTAPTGTKGLRRHLRAALAGILIAAAILIPMQLFAPQGISLARQSALASSQRQTPANAAPLSEQSPAPNDWVIEDTGAAYDRTNSHASPLDLPRCTTSPDTPLPCLATISPDSRRAVVLEEDTSLTAVVRR